MTTGRKAGCDAVDYKIGDWISTAAKAGQASKKMEMARGSPPGKNPFRRDS